MLNSERVNVARRNVTTYLNERLLKKSDFNPLVFTTYVRNHRESLEVAKELYKLKISDLWVIVSSYYSMFYIANAMLYKLGYKVGHKIAHRVTADALIVFIRDKLTDALIESYELAGDEALELSDSHIENFDFERVKRSRLQYETTEEIKRSKAETSLRRAEEFSMELEKLLRSD